METTVGPAAAFDQIGFIRAKTFLNFSTRNGKTVQARAALGFVGVS